MTEQGKIERRNYARQQRQNMTPEQRAARNEYQRNYKRSHPLTDEQQQHKNEYMREWRKRNKEKIKEYNDRYWDNKAKNAAGL